VRIYMGLIALLVVAGCGTRVDETAAAVRDGKDGGQDSSVVTPTLDAKWRGTMTVTPTMAVPGQRVALRFQPKEVRGIAFSLSAWSDQGWTVAYYLSSDWGSPGSHTPDWWAVEDSEGRGWPDVGIGGPGSDHVIVPDTAPAGDYLLCTENSVDEACAILTLTG
jgi:hypothetical protein